MTTPIVTPSTIMIAVLLIEATAILMIAVSSQATATIPSTITLTLIVTLSMIMIAVLSIEATVLLMIAVLSQATATIPSTIMIAALMLRA